MAYHVVFERKEGLGAGVRTWSTYTDENDFKALCPEDGLERVIAQGITEEGAEQLTQATPLRSYFGAALEESRMEDGSLNPMQLNVALHNIVFAKMPGRMFPSDSFMDGLTRLAKNYVARNDVYGDPKKAEELIDSLSKVTDLMLAGARFASAERSLGLHRRGRLSLLEL